MQKRKSVALLLAGTLALTPLAGCEDLPGSKGTQGAVIGGVGGAVAGAAIGKGNRGLGALIGGLLGAGGGYLIGANVDKIGGDDDEDREEVRREAEADNEKAQSDPADASDVHGTPTADLNDDGFVTLDEVVAMDKAGLNDEEILDRLEATGQVFELTEAQEDLLMDQGVSRYVVDRLPTINQEQYERVLEERQVIGQERGEAL